MRYLLFSIFVSIVVCGCKRISPHEPKTKPPYSGSAEIYGAIIDAFLDGEHSGLVLQRETVPFRFSTDHFSFVETIPQREIHELLLSYEGLLNRAEYVPARLNTTNRYYLASKEELTQLFEAPNGWKSVRESFPGAIGILSVSPVAFSETEELAIAYGQLKKGPLSGRGCAFLMSKSSGTWKVTERLDLWISLWPVRKTGFLLSAK